MWANYLPKSNILGIDIRDDCKEICSDLDNVTISILDVTQPSSANFLGEKGEFDLIIDDASHISEDINATFQALWGRVLFRIHINIYDLEVIM